MSAAASRVVLRQSRFAVRRAGVRNASSTTEAAKEKASEVSSKASEGLSKVQSSAGAAASKVGSTVSETANQVGGTTGGIVGRVQGMVPRVTYYSRVGLELGKLIAHQRGMAPPNMATFQSYFQPVMNAARNPASLMSTVESAAAQPVKMLNQVRSMSSAQWMSVGIVAAEVVGFFTVGEMIGRLRLVGYRAKPEHH